MQPRGARARTGTRPKPSTTIKWFGFEPHEDDEEEVVVVHSTEEVVKALSETADMSEPVNLVSIVGPARTGKSFFLASLTQHEGIFSSAAQAVPCTSGVDIARTLFSYDDMFNTKPTQCVPKIALLDCEGQGDREIAADLKLNTPVMLLSKVCIFNWLGQPRKADLLDKLQVLSRTANMVRNTHRGRGDGAASHPFGNLHLVFRDIGGLDRDCDQARDIRELLSSKIDRNSGSSVMAQLETAFESVTIWAFPRPSDDCETVVPLLHTVSDQFNEKMQEFRHTVEQQLRTAHFFGNMKITLALLAEVVPSIVNAVQEDGFIVPDSVVDGMLRKQLERMTESAQLSFKVELDKLQQGDCAVGLSLAKEELRDQCEALVQGLVQMLTSAAQETLQISESHTLLANSCRDLQQNLHRLGHAALQEVELVELKRNTTAVSAAKLLLASQIDGIVPGIPFADVRDLERQLQTARSQAVTKLESLLEGLHISRCKHGGQPTMDELNAEFNRHSDHLVRMNDAGQQVQLHKTFVEEAKEQQRKLEQDVRAREHELDGLRTANQQLVADIQATQKRQEDLQKRNAEMERTTQDLSSQLSSMKTRQDECKQELSSMKQRNQELETRLSQQQQSGLSMADMFAMMSLGGGFGGGGGNPGPYGGGGYDGMHRSSHGHRSYRGTRPSASSSSSVPVNSAGQPIHGNGRFMSHAEARGKGWKG